MYKIVKLGDEYVKISLYASHSDIIAFPFSKS